MSDMVNEALLTFEAAPANPIEIGNRYARRKLSQQTIADAFAQFRAWQLSGLGRLVVWREPCQMPPEQVRL